MLHSNPPQAENLASEILFYCVIMKCIRDRAIVVIARKIRYKINCIYNFKNNLQFTVIKNG